MLCEVCGIREAVMLKEGTHKGNTFMVNTCRKCPYIDDIDRAAKKIYMEDWLNERKNL